MQPLIRRDLARIRQLDHVHRRRVAAPPAASAFERRLELPDRCVPRPAYGIKRLAGAGLTAVALDLEPSKSAVEALGDRRRRLRGAAIAFQGDRPRGKPRRRRASVARWRGASALIFAPRIWLPQMTSRDLVLMAGDYSATGPDLQSTSSCGSQGLYRFCLVKPQLGKTLQTLEPRDTARRRLITSGRCPQNP